MLNKLKEKILNFINRNPSSYPSSYWGYYFCFKPESITRLRGRQDTNLFDRHYIWEECCKTPSHEEGDGVYVTFLDGIRGLLLVTGTVNYGGYQRYSVGFVRMLKDYEFINEV